GNMVGCASERDPINRVQPNAVSKSFFVGDIKDAKDDPEFYARAMLIDVPYGAGDTLFTNSFNAVTRIKWEIQENYLIGRLTYERIQGSDGKGLKSAKPN